MGSFPAMLHEPLVVPHGVLESLQAPSAMDGPKVSTVPRDKCAVPMSAHQ